MQNEVCDPFPPQRGQVLNTFRPLLDPEDVVPLLIELQGSGFPTASKSLVRDAIVEVIANDVRNRRTHHPVQKYLKRLKWDQQERLNRLFIDYFPAALPDPKDGQQQYDEFVRYLEDTATCFLVGAVARIMKPGAKVDCLPVLVGDQGWNKSLGIQALVPDPAWFSDDVSTSLIDRDTKESLVGKWILELAEFPHLKKEIERVKAFFSRQSDRFRAAYGRGSRDWLRQCVFIATANELEFIDPSGNRRFWPVPQSGPVDVDKIKADRDQLWAEAVHRYNDDYKWWLPPKIEAIASRIQDAYLEEDPLDSPVREWVGLHHPDVPDPNDSDKKQCTPFSTPEVLAGLDYALRPGTSMLGVVRPVATKADQMRVAKCLRRLGYVRDTHASMHNGRRERCWQRPKSKIQVFGIGKTM